jgi:hypothetical protein
MIIIDKLVKRRFTLPPNVPSINYSYIIIKTTRYDDNGETLLVF